MQPLLTPVHDRTSAAGIELRGLVRSCASSTGRVRAVRGVDLNYLSAAMRTLGARNRREAVDLATGKGWL